jgi:glutamate synthase (NADPH/NADH) small chain
MDAATTAAGMGVRDVYLVYRRSFREMPAWPEERDRALVMGVHMLLLTQPLGYETDDGGAVTGVRIARTVLGEPDDSGRRRPETVPGSESVLAVDRVVEALGQRVPEPLREALADVPFTDRGRVQVLPGSTFTGTNGVYAGGDLVNGGTTAVQGVAEGMRAAEEIDAQLQGGSPEAPDKRTSTG